MIYKVKQVDIEELKKSSGNNNGKWEDQLGLLTKFQIKERYGVSAKLLEKFGLDVAYVNLIPRKFCVSYYDRKEVEEAVQFFCKQYGKINASAALKERARYQQKLFHVNKKILRKKSLFAKIKRKSKNKSKSKNENDF